MEMSEQIDELATALSVAQGQIQDAEKKSDNPFFNSKYADLAEVLGQIRPIFSKNGLAIIQLPANDGYEVQVTTMIMHKSGQWVRDTAGVPIQEVPDGKHANYAQEFGKICTYLRRYGASAFAGIAQEDVDGNLEAPGKPMARAKKKKDADIVWFNDKDFDKMKDAFVESIRSGDRTAEQIVKNLRFQEYGISKKMADQIKGLEYEVGARADHQTSAGPDVGDGEN